MKPARSKTPARKPIGRPKGSNMVPRDPVQVYCRLRPMQSPKDVSCMRITSDNTTVVITPPESAANLRPTTSKEIQTTLSRVFTSDVTQREIFETVAFPLVENLIHGRNGLLFAYGVTGSGKTYTMTGELQDAGSRGIVPRCLDVIFNTIANYQTRRFVFKPNTLNGFAVQSEAEAIDTEDRQRELLQRNGRPGKRRKVDSDGDSNPTVAHKRNESQSVAVETDNVYAVFVTYVEIYNNNVYDLLDEDDIRTKTPQSKMRLEIREDGNKNIYVHGATEIEVKSAEEAFEVFQRGQRKRRVAPTALNAESSRSHSVFTIRLVQAPLDPEGEYGMQYKRVVCVSQLSLVDLAGSERTNRTKNTGLRLREAGNINNSLMTLRLCLEILRENQKEGTNNKMVPPYRDSRLTYLFKNYFDGEGQVRMIVCVNPRADDYDETIQVMKFAEMTQEVYITRSNPVKLDLGLTPGRRQVNKTPKETRGKLERGRVKAVDLNIDLVLYSLGGRFPQLETITSDNDQVILSLIQFLEQRINKRNILRANLQKKQEDFRRILKRIEKENGSLKNEVAVLKTANKNQKKQISALKGYLSKTETQINDLPRELNNANMVRCLQQEVRDRDLALSQRSIDKQRVKQIYNTKMRVETDKLTREFEMKLHQGREHLQNQMKEQEAELRQVKQIVDDNNINPAIASSRDQAPELTTRVVSPDRDTRISRKDRIAVSNPRYRPSQSADRWIDHRPQTLAPIGTVLQPVMQRRRSVTQLTSPKEITADGASRYCLVAQEHDTDGELETKLYKGDILPTSGGGAQVVFNDMECLKQSSPKARKRTGPREEGTDQVDIATLTKTKRQRVIPS